jgi:hypothetical protein
MPDTAWQHPHLSASEAQGGTEKFALRGTTHQLFNPPAGSWACNVCSCAFVAVLEVPGDGALLQGRVLEGDGGAHQAGAAGGRQRA